MATKRDLDQLADRLDAALHRQLGTFPADVDRRFDAMHGEFAAQTRTLLLGS